MRHCKNEKRIWNLGRRDLLRGLSAGATLLASGAAPGLNARAQSVEPKRFAALFQPNGLIESDWRPSGSGRQFSMLGTVLEPLEAIRDEIILLEGLNLDCRREGGAHGSAHQQGVGCALTGMPLQSGEFSGCGGSCDGGWADGISVDQEIAKMIGAGAPFASVELGVDVERSDNRCRVSYAGPGAPLPPQNDPQAAFDRLFGDLVPSDSTSAQEEELDRIRMQQRSVLDAVAGELGALRSRIGAEHRDKLDAHTTAIRELETRLSEKPSEGGASCQAPDLDAHTALGEYAKWSRQQLDIIATAFACDRTRVASLMWSRGGSYQKFSWLGYDRGWHDMGHETSESAAARDGISAIHRWISGEFVYFVQKLQSLGVFDDTLVLWANELNDPDRHSLDDMKYVLAGSAGGTFDTGKYVSTTERSHNCLLVSCLQAMGGPHTSFGHSDHQSGRIEELFRP